jgi:Flp pilus assembly protein CpaB
VLILVGLILAVVTAAIVFWILTQGSEPAEVQEVERKEVVVAIQPVAEDEPVEGRLGLRPRPVDAIPEGAITSLEETLGMVAAGPIPQDTIIHRDMLLTLEERMQQGELGQLVEEGMVAIGFPINELSSVSYGIQAGDHVDILMSFSFVDINHQLQVLEPICPESCPSPLGGAPTLVELAGQQNPRRAAQLTIQDAEVLGVGRWNYAPPPVDEEAQENQPRGQEAPAAPETPKYITLMISPQDALVVKLAREYGAGIDLAVRAQDDHQLFATEQVTLDYILRRYGMVLPEKLPYTVGSLRAIVGPEE